MTQSLTQCVALVTGFVCRAFYRLGHLVARHPAPFLAVPILFLSTLGASFLFFADHHSDIEDMYSPRNSRAREDRIRVKELFQDGTGEYFNPMSLNDNQLGVGFILRQHDRTNVLTRSSLAILRHAVRQVQNITMEIDIEIVVPKNCHNISEVVIEMTSAGIVTTDKYKTLQEYESEMGHRGLADDVKLMTITQSVTYEQLCARLKGECQFSGSYLMTSEFEESYFNGTVDYPSWTSPWGPVDLSLVLAQPNVTDAGTLIGAGAIRAIFYFRRDSEQLVVLALEWEKHFNDVAEDDLDFGDLDYAYASSHALGNEVDKGTRASITIYMMTFVLMIGYATLVTSGGDCVTSRTLLALGGVLSAGLGIFGSLGLVSLLGIPFVNIVGCMPFLVMGIGLDDMFLMMAAWSGTLGNRELTVPERIGSTFRSAGIGITITSLTDGLAFAVGGVLSVFESIRNFCIYTGTAVLLCYVSYLTFFGGWLACHGRRVYSRRHQLTCRKVRTRDQLRAEGQTCLTWCCCGGAPPEDVGADESVCERAPRVLLPRLVLKTPVKVFILLAFSAFLVVSVWGTMGLQQGLRSNQLVLPDSFYYKYNTWEEDLYGVRFPVSFVIDGPVDYTDVCIRADVFDILRQAEGDPGISESSTHCWLTDFYSSPHFDSSSRHAFIHSLTQKFLPENQHFVSDVVIDELRDVINASRCHVYSESVLESPEQAELMYRLRALADAARFKVFAFQPVFVYFEQHAFILSNTLMTVGVALVAMFLVTFALLVHPLMVFLVLFNVLMIVVGIFGFMGLWGLSLSSVTMIHLIMSVGFSVDFSAHVCAAYMTSEASGRQERAEYALTHASGPILNGGLSSFVGVVALAWSQSYIFRCFFQIMFLVILFGVLHAVFLMPVLLSLLGPQLSPPDRKNPLDASPPSGCKDLANDKLCDKGTVSVVTWKRDNTVSISDWLGSSSAFDNNAYSSTLHF